MSIRIPPELSGSVEPHAGMLNVPHEDQLLYKMMTAENFFCSVKGAYLHFNRVDQYADFPTDGEQLAKDRPGNMKARFAASPDFSAADYYDRARSRTYGCCFSLENSKHIWENFGGGSAIGQICVVFSFGKLRSMLNKTLLDGNAILEYNGIRCHQIFSLNYGIVEYVKWSEHRANSLNLPNPIKYTYIKDDQFSDEKELRVSLSAMGMGHFVLDDGEELSFPRSLQMAFDFRTAIGNGVIQQILIAPNCDLERLYGELHNLGITPAAGSDFSSDTG